MAKKYRIELNEHDLGQLLDGLESRAELWRRTARYQRTGDMSEGELFLIEECRDEEEAEGVVAHFEAILKNIQNQMETQL
jgi:hypothetical protein